MSYKNHRTGQIISDTDYNKIVIDRHLYTRVSESPTHRVEDDGGDDLLLLGLGAMILGSMDDGGSSSFHDYGSSFGNDSSVDYGGGSFGGGGADSSW